MRCKSQSIPGKKINFIQRNKEKVSALSVKPTKSLPLQSISPNIISKPISAKVLLPKSQIPGFSVTVAFPAIEKLSSYIEITQIINESCLYPKASYSDTDCPPSPPSYSLEIVEELKEEEFFTPKNKEVSEIGTQTERKKDKFQTEIRRSERLKQQKELKRKLMDSAYVVKKIKYY